MIDSRTLKIPNFTITFFFEGTDRLENLFCDCHTQDHACNFDVNQLSSKLSNATLINAVFEKNPDWSKGHQRLDLQDAMGVDRIVIVSTISHLSSFCLYLISIVVPYAQKFVIVYSHMYSTQSLNIALLSCLLRTLGIVLYCILNILSCLLWTLAV